MVEKKQSKEWIPDVAFEVIGFGIPALARYIDMECHLTLGGWLVLWCVKQEGKRTGRCHIILTRNLVQILLDRRFKRANISRILKTLENDHLIERRQLNPEEREKLFGRGGNLLAVCTTPPGEDKFEEFKTKLRDSFDRWYGRQERPVRGALAAFRPIAMRVVRALKK